VAFGYSPREEHIIKDLALVLSLHKVKNIAAGGGGE